MNWKPFLLALCDVAGAGVSARAQPRPLFAGPQGDPSTSHRTVLANLRELPSTKSATFTMLAPTRFDEGEVTLNDTIGSDEFADMIATDTLIVRNFTANSGSEANLRAVNKVVLKPGFHARTGSAVRVFRSTTSGVVLSDPSPEPEPPEQE